jgi:hypothetical protein
MDRELEQFVWSRAGSRCEYCQMPQRLDASPFEIDHVVAISWRQNDRRQSRLILFLVTPVGRATIRTLHIHEFLRVRLRLQLIAEGALKDH